MVGQLDYSVVALPHGHPSSHPDLNPTLTQILNLRPPLTHIILQLPLIKKNLNSTGVHDGMGVEEWFGVVGVV